MGTPNLFDFRKKLETKSFPENAWTPVYTNSSSIFTCAVIKNYYGIFISPNVPMRITGMSMSAEDDLTQTSDKVG